MQLRGERSGKRSRSGRGARTYGVQMIELGDRRRLEIAIFNVPLISVPNRRIPHARSRRVEIPIIVAPASRSYSVKTIGLGVIPGMNFLISKGARVVVAPITVVSDVGDVRRESGRLRVEYGCGEVVGGVA